MVPEGAADEKWREEISEGKNEGKGGSGEESGKGKRKNDAEKCFARDAPRS